MDSFNQQKKKYPWKPEKVLWPLPIWIPADESAKFPGEEAVALLVAATVVNFESVEEATQNAIGFVNYRRRDMAQEHLDMGSE